MQVAEWVEYHRLIGIEHFVVFDRTGELRHTLLPLVQDGVLTVVDWLNHWHGHEQHGGNGVYHDQQGILNKCLHRYARGAEWVLVVDPDEYVHLVADSAQHNHSIVSWAEAQVAGNPHIGELRMQSVFFQQTHGEADTIVGRHTTRGQACMGAEVRTKYIAKVSKVENADVHFTFKLTPGSSHQDVPCDVARINHYQSGWEPDQEITEDLSALWAQEELRVRLKRWAGQFSALTG